MSRHRSGDKPFNYLNQWRLVYWGIYASLGFNELTVSVKLTFDTVLWWVFMFRIVWSIQWSLFTSMHVWCYSIQNRHPCFRNCTHIFVSVICMASCFHPIKFQCTLQRNNAIKKSMPVILLMACSLLCLVVIWYFQGPRLLTWINFNPSMDKWSVKWNNLSFPSVNGCTVAVWEWMIIFILHLMIDVNTYPW